MKRLLLTLTFFGLSLNLYAQDLEKTKRSAEKGNLVLVENGCKIFKSNNDYFLLDSVLYNFYTRIESSGEFSIPGTDTVGYLRELLSRAKAKSQRACLLPFLRIFDKRADEVDGYACITTSYPIKHQAYCSMMNIQFIVLFAVQFSFIEKYALNSKHRFEWIKLRKKQDTLNKFTLLQDDYNKIYDLYNKWLDKYNVNRQCGNKNPLTNSEYEWVIETSPKLTKKELEWLKWHRNAR